MNIRKTLELLGICFMFCCTAHAQQDYELGVLPILNINTKLSSDIKLNFKTESRQVLYTKTGIDIQYKLTDFAMLLSKKIGYNYSLSGGYSMRVRKDKIISQLIQQFVIINTYPSITLAHRFSTDQAFGKGVNTKIRLRYRLSGLLPLSGQSVDHKEFYFKINNEYLNAFIGTHHDLEIRFALALGYKFSNNHKLEFGIDNRFSSFIDDDLKTRSWVSLGWYITL